MRFHTFNNNGDMLIGGTSSEPVFTESNSEDNSTSKTMTMRITPD